MAKTRELVLAVALLALASCGGNIYDSPAIDVPIVGSSSNREPGTGLFLQKSALGDSSTGFDDFMGHARDAYGDAPSRVEIITATIAIGPGAKNLNSLERVFANGAVRVALLVDASGDSYPMCGVTTPAGAGPLTMNVNFDSSQLSPSDYAEFVAGRAHVELRGPVAPTFASSSRNASLDLEFVFRAYH
jgi:hypothetical protein